MHLCNVCFYTWRSTEPDDATGAERYLPDSESSLRFSEGLAMPEVPPLRNAE